MKNILEYKGYHTKAEVDLEEGIVYGKIEGIRDLVNFESETLEDFEKEFHLAVDDYIEFCKEVGKTPEKEYKGSFNVRITPELHRKIALLAYKNGDSLNQAVEKAIQGYVTESSQTEITLQETVSNLSKVLASQSSYYRKEDEIIRKFPKFEKNMGFKMIYEPS
ncbi:type II toxin-antitoxin system HicB family antitoxin [Hominiventricola aquisgranensis]|uniref:Type II toxin-antitoxin system HicB family antitoxin n=1 Tax=Hominiventricola aquisgranensis TaxID=3133164 RepID=A0ABV1I4S6_9FIRM